MTLRCEKLPFGHDGTLAINHVNAMFGFVVRIAEGSGEGVVGTPCSGALSGECGPASTCVVMMRYNPVALLFVLAP